MMHDTNRYDVNSVKLTQFKMTSFKKLLKKRFVTGISKDKILENLLNMSDSDNEGQDKKQLAADNAQLRGMEANEKKGTKADKKRKRLENKGIKVVTDSDENSEDIEDEDSGEEGVVKDLKAKKKEEPEKEHKPVKKSEDQIKKGLFLGEKYGHFKIGTYV